MQVRREVRAVPPAVGNPGGPGEDTLPGSLVLSLGGAWLRVPRTACSQRYHGHWPRKAFPTCDPAGANQSPSPWEISDWSREPDLSSWSGKRKAVGPEPPGTSFPTRSRSLGEGQSCHGGRGHNNGGVLLALSP